MSCYDADKFMRMKITANSTLKGHSNQNRLSNIDWSANNNAITKSCQIMKQSEQVTHQLKAPQRTTSDSKKYLMHFEAINTPMKIPPNFLTSISSQKNKYNSALQMYASSVSIIDKIADSPVKESRVSYQERELEDFVREPVIVNLNPRIKERVVSINQFFTKTRKNSQQSDGFQEDGSLNAYIQNIINIDLNNAIAPQQSLNRSGSRSRSKQSTNIKNNERKAPLSPQLPQPKQQVQEVEVNTDPVQPIEKPSSRLKKMDLILVEIMKQKKRKGLVSDYFRAIEMKLVELLEYILQDEQQYFGMNLKEKMKMVLKNLESFKGKTVDGESKVSMLRIFFQEFRNLKKERDEEAEEIENRSKSNSKKSKSKQSKNLSSNQGGQGGQAFVKTKKAYDTQSVGGNRSFHKIPPSKKSSAKSVKEEDQWIGSLDN